MRASQGLRERASNKRKTSAAGVGSTWDGGRRGGAEKREGATEKGGGRQGGRGSMIGGKQPAEQRSKVAWRL
eukprot:1383456-Pleurochrysis_carterae.AAC.1